MVIAFNCIVVALVLLIAYWWGNQGVFSAILHLVCVLVAGALAFTTWETLANLMINRGLMENYAWGIALLLPFAIYLLLTRVASDKLVPGNVNFPQWANLAFGGAAGLISGVLTLGMCLLGGGFLQGTKDIMGFSGSVRTLENKGQPQFDAQSMWVPVHRVTASTFSYLSARSLSPEVGRSMTSAYPKIADLAMSLHRDSAADGRARTAAPASAVELGRFWFSPDCENVDRSKGAYVLEFDVDSTASDSGGTVTVTASQIRLIEDVAAGSLREARIAFPDQWSQPSESGSRQIWPFDDLLNIASNVPGQQKTKFFFFFPAANLGTPGGGQEPPRFVAFKGLRLRLPTLEVDAPADTQIKAIARGAASGPNTNVPLIDPTAKSVATKDLTINQSIAPAVGSINELTTLEQSDQYLTEGEQELPRGGNQPSPANRIKGIYQQDGTVILRLNISRRLSSVDLWNDRNKVREKAGEQATLFLVDARGNQYAPIGYIWVKQDGVTIKLDPKRGIETIANFPNQPSAGTHELYALFNPTAGVKIVSIRLGNEIVANAELDLPLTTK